MKNCDKCREMTDDYIDGLLTDAEKAEFEDHINSCPKCMDELDFSRSIRSELKKIELPSPPPDFLDRINAAIDAENGEIKKSRKIYSFFGRRSVSAIAACALIAVFLGVNADNELTKKISVNDENSDIVFNDIIKQDTNAASELLPSAEKSETYDKAVEEKSSNAAAGAKIKVETNKKNLTSETKSEEITQKESKADETAVGSVAVDEKIEEAPKEQKEESASAEKERTADIMQFSCMPAEDCPAENDLVSGSSGGARTAPSNAKVASKMVPNEKETFTSDLGSVFTVMVDDAERAKKIAEEISTEMEGAYFMTAAEYAKFIEALHDAEIGYSSDAPDNEDVRIILKNF